MSTTSTPPQAPALARTRELWTLMAYAVCLGVVGAFAALVFMGVTNVGGRWYDDTDTGWFGGRWWWIAVTGAAGVVVGLLRRLTRLPDQLPGLIQDLQTEHVHTKLVPGIVAVSAVSLAGGASLGPEMALGSIGGGAGDWWSRRRGVGSEDTRVNTLSGFAGAYGGLFSSTVIVVMLILEVARPGGRRLTKSLVGTIVASSVSFGVYFAIAGAVFVDAYPVPHYEYADWQLPAGVLLGLFAALVVTVLGVIVRLAAAVFARLRLPDVVRATVAGVVFGLIGVALPLTMFTGSDQLATVVSKTGPTGIGLLAALVVAKMLAFGVSEAGGFVGGPIFPTLFVGGTAGVLVHAVVPGVPLGLAFSCMLAAVPGALVSAPFAMVLLAALLTQVGALQTAPVLIAVVTAYLAVESIKDLMARRQARAVTTG